MRNDITLNQSIFYADLKQMIHTSCLWHT